MQHQSTRTGQNSHSESLDGAWKQSVVRRRPCPLASAHTTFVAWPLGRILDAGGLYYPTCILGNICSSALQRNPKHLIFHFFLLFSVLEAASYSTAFDRAWSPLKGLAWHCQVCQFQRNDESSHCFHNFILFLLLASGQTKVIRLGPVQGRTVHRVEVGREEEPKQGTASKLLVRMAVDEMRQSNQRREEEEMKGLGKRSCGRQTRHTSKVGGEKRKVGRQDALLMSTLLLLTHALSHSPFVFFRRPPSFSSICPAMHHLSWPFLFTPSS